MRWRLAYTPIYAPLSERGGNSITICPIADDRTWPLPEPQSLAELEAPGNSQDGYVSMTMDDSPSLQTSQKQTVDTRVLLSVSVVQDAIHDVSHWVSWLTTAAPWDVTKVDVQVHSVFKSYSTLIIVSVPTCAWTRLPERPAYKFVGFIRSGDMFSMVPTSETVSRCGILPPEPLTPHRHEPLPSSFQAAIYPSHSQSDLQSDPQARSIKRRHSPQGTNKVAQPLPKVLRRSSRLSGLGASPSTPRAGVDRRAPYEPGVHSHKNLSAWSPEDDEQLKRARQQGLNWKSIASQYLPDKTANGCRKRHERLLEKQNSTDNWGDNNTDSMTKAYLDVREQMWKMLADRVGEKWQNIEAKVFHPVYQSKIIAVDRSFSVWRKVLRPFRH